MKKVIYLFLVMVMFMAFVQVTSAAVHVNGYYRSNGTYVAPHYRSNPDGNPYNNWSFPGNTNPYTGKTATGDPDTYLNNYYNRSSSGSTYSSSYTSSVYDSFAPSPVLPSRDIPYVAKLWSDSYPEIDCTQSTFLRQKERAECALYRSNKGYYSWNVTTKEYDDKHYHYDPVTQITSSCGDGYMFLYNNGVLTSKCTIENAPSTASVNICPTGYTCTPIK